MTFHLNWNLSFWSKLLIRAPQRCYSLPRANKKNVVPSPYPSFQPQTDRWRPNIGLEIHLQILVDSKLFSGASVRQTTHPNSHVALLDAAIPGTLPRLNRACVEKAIQTAHALNCKVNLESYFDRKHYFYADLPVGYQITQYRRAIANDGHFLYYWKSDVNTQMTVSKANIVQIQLEQDSGKSLHNPENRLSLVDLNRAGIGLMEIITGVDFHNGIAAAEFVEQLSHLLKCLNICGCKLDVGQLRVDANISVTDMSQTDELGVRSEVKNLNSFLRIARAIDFEIRRHISVLEGGGTIVNETRKFDVETEHTLPMRDKEVVSDYRYLPEPNLPPLRLRNDCSQCDDKDGSIKSHSHNESNKVCTTCAVNKLKAILPKEHWPFSIRQQLHQDYNVKNIQFASLISSSPALFDALERVLAHFNASGSEISKELFVYESVSWLSRCRKPTDDVLHKWSDSQVKNVYDFIRLYCEKRFTPPCASDLFRHLMAEHFQVDPVKIAHEKKFFKLTDVPAIKKVCQEIIDLNPKSVKEYRSGKKTVFQFLFRKVHEATHQRCENGVVLNLLEEVLNQ